LKKIEKNFTKVVLINLKNIMPSKTATANKTTTTTTTTTTSKTIDKTGTKTGAKTAKSATSESSNTKSNVKKQTLAKNVVNDEEVEQVEQVGSDQQSPVKKKSIPTFKFDGSAEEVEAQIKEMHDNIDSMQKTVNSQFTIYKHFLNDLGRNFVRNRRQEERLRSKKENRKSATRISPEFEVSDTLAEFMGLESGTKASRTNALAVVSKYVKEQGLNGVEVDADPNDTKAKNGKKLDKRLIQLDDRLEKLFPNLVNVNDPAEMLKFTTIITHLNQHFPAKKEQTTS